MLTGRNSDTNTNFSQENVYINFQLTKKRSELCKEVRTARKNRKIAKFGVDQNGRITVKVNSSSKWVEVTSSSVLDTVVSNEKAGGRS